MSVADAEENIHNLEPESNDDSANKEPQNEFVVESLLAFAPTTIDTDALCTDAMASSACPPKDSEDRTHADETSHFVTTDPEDCAPLTVNTPQKPCGQTAITTPDTTTPDTTNADTVDKDTNCSALQNSPVDIAQELAHAAAVDQNPGEEIRSVARPNDIATNDAVADSTKSTSAKEFALNPKVITVEDEESDQTTPLVTKDEVDKLHAAAKAPRVQPKKKGFDGLGLRDEVLQAIVDQGYEKPSAIQRETIPLVLTGNDLLGQAETGSGKTAAFACPLLSMIDLNLARPQVLVLAPTRELAIQVTEAIETYASHLPRFRALTIYGGQGYEVQLRELKRGVHIVVGTPGRVMDHMNRNTLKLHDLKCLVLDEADEMLRMGFVDDVEWILTKTPQERQILLFSATLPEPIRRIAEQHLKNPHQITVKGRSITADSIRQRYVLATPREKTDMLTRILEAESTEGVIVFVKTRNQTVEVAEKLVESGYSAAPLNGDMPQSHRERTVDNFKSGKLAVLVATDVAARGLDVDRISHVINYDFPHDVEAYVHRIGRTGRAGRSGQAILFVGQREKGRLGRIESATNQRLEQMHKPSIKAINEKRVTRFKERIVETASGKDLDFFTKLVTEVQAEHGLSAGTVAAALAKLAQGDVPLVMKEIEKRGRKRDDRRGRNGEPNRGTREGVPYGDRGFKRRGSKEVEAGMERYRLEVGRAHGVGPKNIVGAIANEAGLDSSSIGRIEIQDYHSTVDLPQGLDSDFFRALKGVKVGGERLRLTKDSGKSFRGGKKNFGKRKFDQSKTGSKHRSRTKVKIKGKGGAKGKKRNAK